jgi:arylsulfatase A-like enzyme
VFTSDHGHLHGHHGLTAKGPFHYEDLIRVPFIVRDPGTVSADERSTALQSLTDLAPTLLARCGLDVPHAMTGVDQTDVWDGCADAARDHVLVENRHEPTAVFAKTYVEERYKLTHYYDEPYGELFDLDADPDEVDNRWDDPAAQDLKHELTRELLFAGWEQEPLPMPRVAVA